jgi:hypothetical protein
MHNAEVIGIKVATGCSVVRGVRESSAEESIGHGWCSSHNCIPVAGREVVFVEVVRVVLNRLDKLNFADHLFVTFLDVVLISNNVNSVSSHLLAIINLIIRLTIISSYNLNRKWRKWQSNLKDLKFL